MLKIVGLFLLVLVNAARADLCTATQLKKQYVTEDEKFVHLLKMDWERDMRESPEWGADLGFRDLAGLWSDDSFAAIERRKNYVDCSLANMKKVKRQKLKEKNQLNFDLYYEKLKYAFDAKPFPYEFLKINQLNGVHSDIVDVLMSMPSQTELDFENKLSRLEKAPLKIDQHQKLLQEGLKRGVTPPKIVLKNVPQQFDKLLTANPKDSALFIPFQNIKNFPPEKVLAWQTRAEKIILEKVYPALKDFRRFLVDVYLPGSRDSISVQALPKGAAWYQWLVRYMTTTEMTPDEIHQLGLSEVARITTEMNRVREKVGFKKDLKAFFEYLQKDPQFYFQDPKDLMLAFRDISKRADAELPKLFKTLPRMTYGIREMPAYSAPSSPAAYYYPGSVETGRAGYFVANTYDLKARPRWGLEALTLHEAVPGHHLQIAIAQELGEMPDFRKYDGYTAFGEGWGLYAESLGERMGFYEDPYSRFGQLNYEMWRAIRLVVDTGLHFKGWTRDQAIKYFSDHLAKSPLEIEVEVDRYIVWPGQALAYKVGQLKILELREKSEKELGPQFDIREFHDAVLGGGAVPLNVLEKRIEQWRAKVKKQKVSKT